jgi:predicted nucleic acid-binding protein
MDELVKEPRIYPDTSVIGGCFDNEFADESRALVRLAQEGRVILLLSDLLAEELEGSPPEVQQLLAGLAPPAFERVFSSEESQDLRDAYLRAKVVGPKHSADAHHIALATALRADVVVSWNFRHIVHWDKIRLFNAVNLREGYPPIEIRSPREVI